MDIMCVTEKTAQNLELAGHPEKGEKLKQDVSNVLYKPKNKKNRQQLNKYRKKKASSTQRKNSEKEI